MRYTIFDLSHWNGAVDFQQAKQAGMEAVICKATQGLTGADPLFSSYIAGAQEAGLLLGAYHFGTDAPGDQQAEYFLETVGRGSVLPVLDFEQNASQMSLEQAAQFVVTVQAKTGIWPMIYADRDHAIMLASSSLIRDNCSLWLASYRDLYNRPSVPPGWKGYDLWQHTPNGQVAGVDTNCDRSCFMGESADFEHLATWWAQHSIKAATAAGG